ncbi:MAG TPA: MarR family transcriptional regulator [Candidatus Methylomirabilis sp.]|nr:MarR family transcriptional regulator [Candidatus Methylomirabilis sp.]
MGRGRAAPREAVDYRTLAELRYHIRRFLRTREVAARAAGVEPQQYLVLLQIKGLAVERPATLSALAERLQLRHHTVVELVDRLAEGGLVTRRRTSADRRRVIVELRPAGEAVLEKLARYSIAELRTEGPSLLASLARLIGGVERRGRGSARARHPAADRRPRRATGDRPRSRADSGSRRRARPPRRTRWKDGPAISAR